MDDALRTAWVDREPVFAPGTLDRLADELESEQVAHSVAGTYLRLLPERVGRVEAALTTGDDDDATEVLLSLRVTSNTVGASRVAARAEAMVQLLEAGERDSLWEQLGRLARDTADTEDALAAYLSPGSRP